LRWVSAISDDQDLERALDQVCRDVVRELRGDPLDLLFVHASQQHLFDLGRVLPRLRENFGDVVCAGCSADAVIGSHLELEERPGLVVLGAHLPAVQTRVTHVRGADLPPLDGSPAPWRELLGVDPALSPDFVVLADPFSIETQRLLQGIDYGYPEATVIGGLASGARGPGANALFVDDCIERDGALVVALWGNIRIDAIVAQGCRPIGAPYRVTDCEGNLVRGLDGRLPTEALQEIFDALDEDERRLAQRALHVGLVVDELREEIGAGDFLVRNILGLHRESGILAVGADLHHGQTVQFHVRDARTAAQDLVHLLERYVRARPDTEPAAALQFSCLGRGQRLFGVPHHDVARLQEALGPLPVAGFFCNGEIGPVGGSTYVHGYTTSIGVVRPRSG
jgi:small ligand-binding sensory domain FIST